MKIKTTDYNRHVIGDNVALSFDDFYEDLKELRSMCPDHTQESDYWKYNEKLSDNTTDPFVKLGKGNKLSFVAYPKVVLIKQAELHNLFLKSKKLLY